MTDEDSIEVVMDGDKITEFHRTLTEKNYLPDETYKSITRLMADISKEHGYQSMMYGFALNLVAAASAIMNSTHTVIENENCKVEITIKENDQHQYIDCTSGEYHMIGYKQQLRIGDSRLKYIEKFRRCYRDGQEKSRCGRMVIAADKVLDNIAQVMRSIEPPEPNTMDTYHLANVLEVVLKGITDHTGRHDTQGHYLPKE